MGWLIVDENARDICYRNLMGDAEWAQAARDYLEELYKVTFDVLDTKFQQQAKDSLHSCFAEMYFAAVCRKRLSLSISHPSDMGLDFFLNDYNCWVECVAPTNGDMVNHHENAVPIHENFIPYEFPERQYLLRLSSAFFTKSAKIINDKQKGLILDDQSVVIFISVGALDDRFSFSLHPPIFHMLLGLGTQNILLNKDARSIISTEYEHRGSIEKIGTADGIKLGAFFDSSYEHVSAVIYSWADFSNPYDHFGWGRDFFILHNPLAKNKIPYGFIPCGKEFYVDMDSKSIVRYKIYDPDYD